MRVGFHSLLDAIKALCILLSGHLAMNHLHSCLLSVSSIREEARSASSIIGPPARGSGCHIQTALGVYCQ